MIVSNQIHQFMIDRGFEQYRWETKTGHVTLWKHQTRSSDLGLITHDDAKFWYQSELKARINELQLSKVGEISTRTKIANNKRIKALETLLKESEEL